MPELENSIRKYNWYTVVANTPISETIKTYREQSNIGQELLSTFANDHGVKKRHVKGSGIGLLLSDEDVVALTLAIPLFLDVRLVRK